MAHPLDHARSSVIRHGGRLEDYLAIHQWFDASKEQLADFRHRALRHHAEGIFAAEREFGLAIINSDGQPIPVRVIGEQHVLEDLGHIPTLAAWLMQIKPASWMTRRGKLADGYENVAYIPAPGEEVARVD